MRSSHRLATLYLRRGALIAGLLVLLALALAPAAPAARSGRVAPENRWSGWAPGRAADALLSDAWVQHWIYDAQPTGTLALTVSDVAPQAKLVAVGRCGQRQPRQERRRPLQKKATTPTATRRIPAASQGRGSRYWSEPLAVAVCQDTVPGPVRCT